MQDLTIAQIQKVIAIDKRVIQTKQEVFASFVALGEYFIELKAEYKGEYKALLSASKETSYEQANKFVQIAKSKNDIATIKSVVGDTFLPIERNIDKVKAVASAVKKGGVNAGVAKVKEMIEPKETRPTKEMVTGETTAIDYFKELNAKEQTATFNAVEAFKEELIQELQNQLADAENYKEAPTSINFIETMGKNPYANATNQKKMEALLAGDDVKLKNGKTYRVVEVVKNNKGGQ